jgi:hypothetical protein
MIIDEQTHGSGLARNEGRIDHQNLRIRHGYAKIGQACVQHVAYSAAAQFAGGNLQAAVRLQANGRRGPDDSATHSPIEQCGGGCHQQVPHTHVVSFPRLNIARPGRGPQKNAMSVGRQDRPDWQPGQAPLKPVLGETGARSDKRVHGARDVQKRSKHDEKKDRFTAWSALTGLYKVR